MKKQNLAFTCGALMTAAAVSFSCFTSYAAPSSAVTRNTTFTTMAQMKSSLGSRTDITWTPVYLTEPENDYWTFADQSDTDSTVITLNIAKNAYRNLEMLLDDGYTMDYNDLSAYCAEYLGKKNGIPDSYYKVLTSCLDNPYILNRPGAKVTATTYNGRDYSSVFDASYYASTYPDIAAKAGNDPAKLLRDFVESGINAGRRGNASFDIDAYIAQTDAAQLSAQTASSSYKVLGSGAVAPLGKYSYSRANYYGKYLGHYAAATATDYASGKVSASTDDPAAKTAAGIYTESNTLSVYTNEPVSSSLANQRPIAIMMPTDSAAQPSYGIGRAAVLYEIMEEGGISRQMALIPDWQGMSRIGNVRSCRLYYINIAREWDPILIHFGGVAYMKGSIDAPDINNISGTYEYGTGGKAPGAGFFFRTDNRPAPHNAYISSSGILKACAQQGYQTSLRDGYYNSNHFTFAAGVNDLSQYGSQARSAEGIDLAKIFTYTKTDLNYSASESVYYKDLHRKAQVDAITGKQLTFENVIIQNANWRQLDKKGYLDFDVMDTTEDGWYCTKGKAIHITWKKETNYGPTRYYDDNGNEIQMNTGKTYIAVAENDKSVIFK